MDTVENIHLFFMYMLIFFFNLNVLRSIFQMEETESSDSGGVRGHL